MVGLKIKDINKDILTIFILCYEYDLNFNQVIKLYAISDKYFWIFLEICGNMTKVGNRKAVNIKKSVSKILNFLNGDTETSLTTSEDKILQMFMWYVQDSFTDGDSCFHINQLSVFPFVKGFGKDDVVISSSYEDIKNNLDRIEYIEVADTKYYKTSRILYYLEKYKGTIDIKEINNMTISEAVRTVQESKEDYIEWAK